MSDVSVLGTGLMGSALARTFMAAGHKVVVWNRTAASAEPMIKEGAQGAATAAEAFGASPLSVVCVRNYDAAKSFMQSPVVEKTLNGKTLLQLSTGTTREARDAETWARRIGCTYLDGKIMSYPAGIGRESTLIYVSGSQAVFDAHRGLLAALGGRVTYLGESVAYSATLDMGRQTAYWGHLFGFLYSLSLCQKEGYPIDQYVAAATVGMAPVTFEAFNRIGRTVQQSTFDDTDATVDILGACLDSITRTFRDAGLNAELPALLLALCGRASAAGLATQDISALIKVLGGPAP